MGHDLAFIVLVVLTVTSLIQVADSQNATLQAIFRQSLQDADSSTAARPGQAGGAFGAVQRPVPSGESPQDKLDLFSGQTEDPRRASQTTRSGLRARNFLRNSVSRSGLAFRSREFQDNLASFGPTLAQTCETQDTPSCTSGLAYRMPDGTCNNLNPSITRGASFTVQPRFVPSQYDDGFGEQPRTLGRNGQKLESARRISNVVFSTTPSFRSPISNRYTLTLVHFGQFVDHDIISTPATKIPNPLPGDPYNEDSIRDCDENCVTPKEHCFPISIPDDNFQNKFGTDCMHFVRHKPAAEVNCQPVPRQHINERTSFLDLSSTYGSTLQRYNELREDTGGRLNASIGDLLPFGPAVDDCLSGVQKCFNSGDDRHQEIPMLTVLHVNFLREHNRIAGNLSQINPSWDNDKLFQEAKKILTGIYQHIVYNEFLPPVVGFFSAYTHNLLSFPFGFRNSYNPNVDPSTRNEFGAAAYRFGHSLVGRFVNGMKQNLDLVNGQEEMRHDFFNNEKIRDPNYGPKRIGRWMAETAMRRRDRFISEQLRNHLFENVTVSDTNGKSNGFDLSAFNIQRGRDHGIPGYNEFRKFCGLFPAYTFTSGFFGFYDHDSTTVQLLSQVYSHPDDVDLFTGGISERPSFFGDILGPTFKCLVALQFQYYKEGDRFFYENPFPDSGFTFAQINDIKRQTFAGIFCRSLGLSHIQRRVFEKPSFFNPRVPCDSIPEPTLDLWKV